MIGQVCGRVFDVSPVLIHGDEYFDVLVQTPAQEELGQGTRFRVPRHALADGLPPARGGRVELTLLMQQVTLLRALPEGADGQGGFGLAGPQQPPIGS